MATNPNSMLSGRKGVFTISGIAVAVIAIVYFAFFYPPVPGDNAQGSIGGAKKANKYLSEQITDKDVELSSTEVQVLLQNDQVQNLIKSPEFQDAMKSPAFLEALKAPAFLEALKAPAFREALKAPAFLEALKAPAFRDALKAPAFHEALKAPAFREALKSPAFLQGLLVTWHRFQRFPTQFPIRCRFLCNALPIRQPVHSDCD